MTLYQLIAFIAFLFCFISLSYHFYRLIKLGLPNDYSFKTGNLKSAIPYSFTGAMNPLKKESAYLHFPTYTAGIFYHIGTFISIALFFFFLFNINLPSALMWIITGILIFTILSGLGIFVKRIFLKKLRFLSSPDDFISNLLVTVFQTFTVIMLLNKSFSPYYNICAGLLFLYIPLGKLRHVLYFFAARFHLGFYYGWRGVWAPKSHEQIK